MNDDLIHADGDRARHITERLMRQCYEDGEERGDTDVRVEAFMVIGILVWTDDDGDENEDIIIASETKRRYVQKGILQSAVWAQKMHDLNTTQADDEIGGGDGV